MNMYWNEIRMCCVEIVWRYVLNNNIQKLLSLRINAGLASVSYRVVMFSVFNVHINNVTGKCVHLFDKRNKIVQDCCVRNVPV